jgi:hypothetical protein
MNPTGGVGFALDAHVNAPGEIEGVHELGLDGDWGARRCGAGG